MTDKDLETIKRFLVKNRKSGIKSILLISPDKRQIDMVSTLFDSAEITVSNIGDYDIMSGPHKNHYDIIFLENVLMYLEDPETGLNNLLASCNELWVQDLIRGRRMSDAELGDDGDRSRFSFSKFGEDARIKSLDISSLERVEVIDVMFYSDNGPPGYDCRKFIASLKQKERQIDTSNIKQNTQKRHKKHQ